MKRYKLSTCTDIAILNNLQQYVISIRLVESPEQADATGIIQSIVDAILVIPGLARLTHPHPKIGITRLHSMIRSLTLLVQPYSLFLW